MTRVYQANLNRSRLADDLLYQLVFESSSDVALISEQYRDREQPTWFPDVLGTSAVWIVSSTNSQVERHGRGEGFVWVKYCGTTFFSCYLTPNEPIQSFRDKVDALEDTILGTSGDIVVGGDINAKALEWGMPHPDSRGKYVLEMAARTGLIVLNTGSATTFRRPGYTETIPDVSFATEGLVPRIKDWTVGEEYTGSDHQAITFSLSGLPERRRQPTPRPCGWNTAKLDADRFAEALRGLSVVAEPDAGVGNRARTLVDATMASIEAACNAAMPKKSSRRHGQSAYWWTPEIAQLRRRCLHLRRIAQRAKGREEANARSEEHKEAKKALRHAINRSKVLHWQKLVADVDSDPWGLGYKIVRRRFGAMRPPANLEPAKMLRIVRGLFPDHPLRRKRHRGGADNIALFSAEELRMAVESLPNRKAPGPDGIPYEVLKLVHQCSPNLLLDMYNACLEEGVFPHRWKKARLVLIRKKEGDLDDPSTYRPLCMLDTAGKVLEKLIRARLHTAIEDAGGLSPHQYGFRRGRSTADALREVTEAVSRAEDCNHHSRCVVLLVTLDVRNAFNSARWTDILEALECFYRVPLYLLRMFDSYLEERAIVYETSQGQRDYRVTSGVAQGSILGPDLWNILYDALLTTEMPVGVSLVGYADDIALLITARDVGLAQLLLNQAMRRVNRWMEEHGLMLALSKTEIVVLTKSRMDTIVPLRVGEAQITTRPAVKYLGVLVDTKLTFWPQILRTADKAAKMTADLGRLMANTGGPGSGRRRLLMSTVQSVLLYGAEVWADALNKELYRKRLAQVQRRAALRVTSAYRTVSEPAVLVVAGIVPIALLAQERKRAYIRKRQTGEDGPSDERDTTLNVWQRLWEDDGRGRWTARLIPYLRPWVTRRHGEVDFYLTQFLTGHGYFRSYLRRMGKMDSEVCLYCAGEVDDAHHTFFVCQRWAEKREAVANILGLFSPETVILKMVESEESWLHVARYVQWVLRTKKSDLDRVAL